MTRDEINKLPPDRLTALLAERVMGWTLKSTNGVLGFPRDCFYWDKPHRLQRNWNPTTDRNDLAELMSSVLGYTQQRKIESYLEEEWNDSVRFPVWLLTCDPLIICRAVAVACFWGDE